MLTTTNIMHPFYPYVYFKLTDVQAAELSPQAKNMIDTIVQSYNMQVWYNVAVNQYDVNDILNNVQIRDTAQTIIGYLTYFGNSFDVASISEENSLDFVPGTIYVHFAG